jgi:hypothetical protein
MLKTAFEVEITAVTQDELDEAYEALIRAAIDISNSQETASITVMERGPTGATVD